MRWITCVLLAIAAGCSSKVVEEPRHAPPKAKVTAPGVNVEVEKRGEGDGKVKVQAPGVDIEVKKK